MCRAGLAGRQTKVTLPDPDGGGPLPAPTTFTTLADGEVDYDYDDRGQLTGADYANPLFTDEAFDGNGNRTNTVYTLDPYNRYAGEGAHNTERVFLAG